MSEFENNSHFAPSDGFNINELTGIDGKLHQQQLKYLLVFIIVVLTIASCSHGGWSNVNLF